MRILIYGDSNSFGTAPMPGLSAQGVHPKGARWPDRLAAARPGDEIVLEALPGRTTVHDDPIEGAHKNGLAILPAILESHGPIDLMALCLGTNDFKARFGLGAEDVALGAGRLLRMARSSGLVERALLVAPPPPFATGAFGEMFAGAERRGAGLAGHMARVAAAEGADFLDAGALFSCDPLDGIHWSAESHARLAGAITDRMAEMYP